MIPSLLDDGADDGDDQDRPYFNSMQASGYSTGFYRPPVENNNNPSAIQRNDDKNKNKFVNKELSICIFNAKCNQM